MLASLPGSESGLEERQALLGALRGLDRLLETALEAAAASYGWERDTTQFRGLYVTPADAARLLERSPCSSPFGEAGDAMFFQVDDVPQLARLAEAHSLCWFDCAAILIALAPELDLRYERLYAYLQDDVTRRRPSVELILNLLCPTPEEKFEFRARFAPDHPLLRRRLIRLSQDNASQHGGLLSRLVAVDECVVRTMVDARHLDSRLDGVCRYVRRACDLSDLPLESETREGLLRTVRHSGEGNPLRLWLSGPPSLLHRAIAESIALEQGRPLLAGDLRHTSEAADLAVVALGEAAWSGAVLFLEMDQAPEPLWRAAGAAIAESDVSVILSAAAIDPAFERVSETGRLFVPVRLPASSFATRHRQWSRACDRNGVVLDGEELDALAGRFPLPPDEIGRAVELSVAGALWQGRSQVLAGDIANAARAFSGRHIGQLARKIEPVYSWDDIVLPAGTLNQLQAICDRVKYRRRVLDEWGFDEKLSMGKGVTALFAGPSGAGKTMAAEVLARDLAIDLYKIDLASVVSKYIGETEKNLDRIFTAAEGASAILFFDEADALFGKRSEVKDSHDRYANIEVSYLLQKMEMYDGVAILATNLRQNLDEAFLRRLAFTIHFPFPDLPERRRIWEGIWPAATPLSADVDLDFLAAQFKLSGGNIRNIALAAAFLAASEGTDTGMRHLVRAIEAEFHKLGKPLAPEAFGPYAEVAS